MLKFQKSVLGLKSRHKLRHQIQIQICRHFPGWAFKRWIQYQHHAILSHRPPKKSASSLVFWSQGIEFRLEIFWTNSNVPGKASWFNITFPWQEHEKGTRQRVTEWPVFYSGKDSVIAREKMQQTTRQKSSVDYDGKWQRKQRTPEELEIRKRNIEQILKRRRNGICSEVERSWFIQGAYLEKHRHNLKVTQDLISRGLLYPWCWSVYLLYLFAVISPCFLWLKKFFTKKLKF